MPISCIGQTKANAKSGGTGDALRSGKASRRGTVLAQGLNKAARPVTELDGKVSGFATAGPYRPRPAYRHAVEDTVYVAPGCERRGLGRALVSALIDDCTALGYRRMVAVVGDSANLSSIRLHEKLGFSQAGRIPSVGFKFGRWIDIVILQRPLGQGDRTLPND